MSQLGFYINIFKVRTQNNTDPCTKVSSKTQRIKIKKKEKIVEYIYLIKMPMRQTLWLSLYQPDDKCLQLLNIFIR